MALVSNCGGDENGRLWGGAAGDQTGREYKVCEWSYWGQTLVYRHPDARVRETIAELARQAAENDNIGYDQSQRLTFYWALQRAGWHPSDIDERVEADCSASTGAIIVATGHLLNVQSLLDYDYTVSTHYMADELETAGFRRIGGPKYTSTDDYLLAGDISLKPGYHVNIAVTNGDLASREIGDEMTEADFTRIKSIIHQEVASAVDSVPYKVWGYRNEGVEKKDIYQIVRDIRTTLGISDGQTIKAGMATYAKGVIYKIASALGAK